MNKSFVGRCVVLLSLFVIGLAHADDFVFTGSGAWETGSNWDQGTVPTASDNVFIPAGKSVSATSSVVCHDLSVAGTLTVTAAPLADLTPYGGTEGELQLALYRNATVVSCSGDMTLAAGAKVIPANDPLTGTPVIFRAQDITVEAGATVDASTKGWAWYSYKDSTPPDNVRTNNYDKLYTYGLGVEKWNRSWSFYLGAGYGGTGAIGDAKAAVPVTYGFDFAPLMCGTPGGPTTSLGGGTICLQATGDLVVRGTLKADGCSPGSGSSGGGIWLAGATVSDVDAELISASALDCSGWSGYCGGGGRIAVSVGYTAAQLETMAGGTLPAGSTISHAAANICAKGGANATYSAIGGKAGTVVLTANPDTSATIGFVSPGLPSLKIAGIPPASCAKPLGATEFVVPEFAYWTVDPTGVRYRYDGAIVSNATSEVATFTAAQRELSFTTVAGAGPYVVTLKWKDREALRRLEMPAVCGTFKVNDADGGSSTSFWARADAETKIELVPASGCAFKCWSGTYPRVHAKGNPMTAASDYSFRLTALVTGCEAAGQAISWKSNVVGSWDDPTKWSTGTVPTLLDDVTVAQGTVSVPECFAAKSLTVSGGSVTVGKKDGTTPVFGTVAGNVTVASGKSFTVCAARPFTFDKTSELTFQNSLYDAASVVRIGGALTVNGTLYTRNDPLTGVPVVWRVGSFAIGATGSVVADCGFCWRMLVEGDPLFEGAFQNAAGSEWYTHGYGRGYQYNNYAIGGGGHGGNCGNSGPTYGRAYGFEYAPLLPGSPSARPPTAAGEDLFPIGTVCVFSEGGVAVDGSIVASGATPTQGSRSGGAIWLSGSSIALADAAVVNAAGERAGSWQSRAGGGGRVLFTIGVSDATLDQLIAGEQPENLGLTVTEITDSQVSVAGGIQADKKTRAENAPDGDPGTKWQLLDASAMTDFSVVGDPENYIAEDVAYSKMNVNYGTSLTRTAPDWAYNTESKIDSRYAYAGYVVSNETEVVSTGTAADHTATISFVKPQGPYWLVWKWGARETYHTIAAVNADWGSVTLNGAAYEYGTPYWSPEERTDVIVATPVAGCEFVCWLGDVPDAQKHFSTLNISAKDVYHVKAVFRQTAAAATYHWKAGTTGDWEDAANWDEGNLPGTADSAVFASGTCTAQNRFALQNLVVSNTASLTVKGCRTVSVAGDVLVADTAKLRIVALATDATHTWTNGATIVSVGGTLCITNTATLYPECEDYTGGAPVFRVKNFHLCADATVNAVSLGFKGKPVTWTFMEDAIPENLCPDGGNGAYRVTAGGYGGFGGGYKVGVRGSTYGLPLTPIHPGAAGGVQKTISPGGGLVRIHADRMRIDGTIDASSAGYNGDASGGGIWLTTANRRRMAFGAGAQLLAHAAECTDIVNNKQAGGGRISVGVGLTDEVMARMIAEGQYPIAPTKHVFGFDEFAARYPGVTIDVNPGAYKGTVPSDPKYHGTFTFVDGTAPGLMILVR